MGHQLHDERADQIFVVLPAQKLGAPPQKRFVVLPAWVCLCQALAPLYPCRFAGRPGECSVTGGNLQALNWVLHPLRGASMVERLAGWRQTSQYDNQSP